MGNGFVFEGQSIDFLVRQTQAEVLVQCTHDSHGHGRRAPQSHAAGHLRENLYPHRPPAQAQFVEYHAGRAFK